MPGHCGTIFLRLNPCQKPPHKSRQVNVKVSAILQPRRCLQVTGALSIFETGNDSFLYEYMYMINECTR